VDQCNQEEEEEDAIATTRITDIQSGAELTFREIISHWHRIGASVDDDAILLCVCVW